MRAVGLSMIVMVILAAVLAGGPAGAGEPDDYEPGPCIDNGASGGTPFGDLRAGAFYLDAVEWAYLNAIVEGTGATTFSPDDTVTRGQFAAMLHRSLCLPEPTADAPFTDLRAGAFYRAAVDWLWSEDLTTGVAPNRFGPDEAMTRGQFATFLHRVVGTPLGAPRAGFLDVDRAGFYANAVDWLLLRGLTTGVSECAFGPDQLITRAEVVTFLYRLNAGTDSVAHFITLLCGLDRPTAMAQNPVTGTWFIAEKGGSLLRWADDGASQVAALAVSGGSEQGLLGLAIPEDGGHIYLSYTDTAGNSRIAEHELDGDDIVFAAPRDLFGPGVIRQPASNHNGGDISFGPDGFLYYGLGDGGGANDTYGNGQNTSSLLGSILRIDPASPSGGKAYGVPADNPFVDAPGYDEIWLYGVRNPWRFSFDMQTGDLWVADVGQSSREEFTRMSGTDPGRGANLGWPRWEGALEWAGRAGPDEDQHLGPVHEYDPPGNQSITGGFVYRGDAVPELDGAYLWADFYDPALMGWSDAGGITNDVVTSIDGRATSFGQDTDGEVYVLTFDGRLRKLVAG